MKKILVKGYFCKNLGDDLFLKILCERYNDTFTVISNTKKYLFNNNLNWIHNNIFIRIINKIFKKITGNNIFLNKMITQNDFAIIIGGSIFMEKNYSDFDFYNLLNSNKKDYYIIGSNIGPYTTKRFLQRINDDIFKKAKYVCFRDKKSVDLVKNPEINCASDIVFSFDFSKYINNNQKKVFISVIDCVNRFDIKKTNEYDKFIIDSIEYFDKMGYEVVLASFCKKEKDMDAINRILKTIHKKNIRTFDYDGNIDEILWEMGNSEYIIGSRFHANIIGLSMGKKVLPIAYNLKTINALNDIGFEGSIINMEQEFHFDKDIIDDLNKQNAIDIDFCKKDSLNHFKELDKILELRGKKNE